MNIHKVIFLSFLIISAPSFATTYYIDGSIGSDSYNGTSLTHPSGTIGPWKNLARIETANLQAGDTVYIRGGTYNSTRNAAADIHLLFQDLHGTSTSPIMISAYNGEKPIFDLLSVGAPTALYPFGVVILNSQHVHFKGITIRNLKQVASGLGISRGFELMNSDNCTIELLDVFNIGGAGIGLANSNNNLILNNDSHHNGDGLGDPANPSYGIWNTGDGIDIGTGGDTSTGNTFEGNRTYLNCDDGFDAFDWNGTKVTYKNNWSFWNGVKPWKNSTTVDPANMTPGGWSNVLLYKIPGWGGEGFKLGGHAAGSSVPNYPDPNSLRKFLNNNLSFENTGGGFQQNMDAAFAHKMQLVNNVAWGNGNDGFGFGAGRSSNPSIAHIFKNNIGLDNNRGESGGDFVFDGTPTNISNNYWATWYQLNSGNLYPAITTNAADFLSLDTTGVDGPRQADGSLPNINFLKLPAGSDLIDKGTPINNLNGVTISYSGSAPDLGAFEYGSSTSTPDTTNPVVSFTLPTAGSIIAGTSTLSATATDNSGTVSKIDFYYGTTFIASDTATPFSVNWNTTTVADGNYTLNAKAYDAAGNMGTANVMVTVKNVTADTTNPTVAFTSPANGSTISGTKTLSATASDNSGTVSKVDFYDGGTLLFSDTVAPFSYNWNTTSIMNGSHTLYAKAYDPSDNMQTASIMVTISNTVVVPDTTAPAVTFTAPANNSTISGLKELVVNASDNTGTVTRVEFYDDTTLIYTDMTSPFAFDWDTTVVADGNHVITAKAFDAANNMGTASITITVSNTLPNEPPTSDKPNDGGSSQLSGTSTVKSGCQSSGASFLLFFLLPILFVVAQRRKFA